MLTPEQIELFNPANAKKLSAEDLAFLAGINDDELKQLAERYPAQANGVAYLVMHDKNAKAQVGKVSTYPALYSLRNKHKQTQYSIAGFTALQTRTTAVPGAAKQGLVPGKIVDLTDKELAAAPGLKKGGTKVAKEITGDENKDTSGDDDQKTVVPPTNDGAPVVNQRPATAVVADIKAAKSIDEIDALIQGDQRKTVLTAAAAAKAQLA